ncbi:MAG: histidine phosphatase family protein [Pseudomonadota bacterium]
MAILLMRHTRPVLGQDVCYGALDIELANTFASDAETAVATLPTVQRIVASPLQRARRLAENIASRRQLSVHIDERVREMDFGQWEGQPWSALPRDELDAWAADFLDAKPHGGECVRAFRDRCLNAMNDYKKHDGTTLIVCHAGVVRAVFATGNTADDFKTSIGYGETIAWPDAATRNTSADE